MAIHEAIKDWFEGVLFATTFLPALSRLEKQQRSDVQLSAERLAILGIMGTQMRVPLKATVHHCTNVLRDVRELLVRL